MFIGRKEQEISDEKSIKITNPFEVFCVWLAVYLRSIQYDKFQYFAGLTRVDLWHNCE